ncbi:aspartic-type endopeptidase [Lasallia pustulata]|uniref:Aspartic-type endopeptidase n=1 Tax=Lasallia pustulata TaxID=136370 RepID=A0A1W5D4E3_9LECA|nr:aspartic-type endopeptidase [Lasallia pustulata]
MDGILGLGRVSSNELGVSTVMEVLDQDHLLKENIIGIHLQRSSDGTKDGQITFGAVDKSKFNMMSYTDSTSEDSMWEIPADDAGELPTSSCR